MTEACSKPVLDHANYDQEINNSRNTLRPRRFKWCDLSAEQSDENISRYESFKKEKEKPIGERQKPH